MGSSTKNIRFFFKGKRISFDPTVSEACDQNQNQMEFASKLGGLGGLDGVISPYKLNC